MEKTDCIIIGAGVVGLAIARELAGKFSDVVIVDRHDSFGRETSSRNSEVIHGGMYYPAQSLKARLCIEGRRNLYDLCAHNRIAFRKTGKLIIACESEEEKALEALFQQGQKNGVEGLRMVSGKEITRLEPEVRALCGLHSAETGIIDSHALMTFYYQAAVAQGIMAVFGSEVVSIRRFGRGYVVAIKGAGEIAELETRVVINSAGLDSDTIAQMIGFDCDALGYRLHYCKGQYFRVTGKKSGLVSQLVYPVPKPKGGGLGIHVTRDLAGGMRLGPDDAYLKNREQDYSVDSNRRAAFCASVKRFLPAIEEADLIPDTAGIRPKLQPEGGSFRDFIIQEETPQGFPGVVNLIGIESPGLTASTAIAALVKSFL